MSVVVAARLTVCAVGVEALPVCAEEALYVAVSVRAPLVVKVMLQV